MGTAGFDGSFAQSLAESPCSIMRCCPREKGLRFSTAPLQASPITGSAVIFVEDHVIQISRLHMEGKHFKGSFQKDYWTVYSIPGEKCDDFS